MHRFRLWQGKALESPQDHTPKLWMVHKTRNELVTRHDPEGRATVFDRLAKLKMPDTLMPVVRGLCIPFWFFESRLAYGGRFGAC